MKKVAIVCAAGKQGKLLVDEAVSRGYAVTGFVRNDNKVINAQAKIVVKDLFDLTKEDLLGFDVVIDAFGVWAPELLTLHRKSLAHLCDILSGTGIRLLVVGGAGSLYVNKEHTLQVKDLPDFPEIYKPLANAQSEALDDLRKRNDVKWTFLSPAGNFVADGARTGKYLVGGEEYFVNDKGVSEISYADYAIAMIDEIENAKNIQKRFSVIGE
ncbi:MAG: NAD(P)-dependent oxidoreductase [Christensenellales bacterium]